MSNSVRPHPRDSLGKNTGVGCHFLLQCIKLKSESEVAQPCLTLHNLMDCSLPGSSVHGIFQARVLKRAVMSPSSSPSVLLLNCIYHCRDRWAHRLLNEPHGFQSSIFAQEVPFCKVGPTGGTASPLQSAVHLFSP